jgi:hypothetical protein
VILAFLRLQADCCPWRTLECKAVDAGQIQMWLSPTRQVVAIPAAKDGVDRPYPLSPLDRLRRATRRHSRGGRRPGRRSQGGLGAPRRRNKAQGPVLAAGEARQRCGRPEHGRYVAHGRYCRDD